MDSTGYGGNTETVKGWMKFSSGPVQTVFSVQHHGHGDIPEGSIIRINNAYPIFDWNALLLLLYAVFCC